MKKFKKAIALVLAVVMSLSISTVAFADNANSGQKLQTLGLLSDASDADLASELTRAIGLTMILKNAGYKQADADAAPQAPFTDTQGWIGPWANLAYEKGITKGTSATTFSPDKTLSEKEFVSLQLRALGYADVWDNYKEVAKEVGIPVTDAAKYTKGGAADVMFAALGLVPNGGTEKLIEKLINDGKVDRAKAAAVGLVPSAVEIKSAKVTGVKTVTVEFNQPVDTTKATIAVKKGVTPWTTTVTWNDKKDVATVTGAVNFLVGDYTVEVTGLTDAPLTKAITVTAEASDKIEVVGSTVALVNSAKVEYKVLNQYGEAMNVTAGDVTVTAYNVTQSKSTSVSSIADNGKLKLQFGNLATKNDVNEAKLDDVIRVTLVYKGVTAQVNLTVVRDAASAAITFGEVAPLKDKTRITIGEEGLVIPYTLNDQYGASIKLDEHTAADGAADVETISGVQFTSSNPKIVDVDTFRVDKDGKLTFSVKDSTEAGTATIIAVINSSGAVATLQITVYSKGAVDQILVAGQNTALGAGEKVELAIMSAADQFGTTIAAKDIVLATADNTPNGIKVSADKSVTLSVAKGKVVVDSLVKGTITITIKTADEKKVLQTITLQVEDAAKAKEIKSITFGPKFEADSASAKFSVDNFVVLDQYSRTMKIEGADYTVAAKDSSTLFTLSAKDGDGKYTFTSGATAGSQEFTLSVIKGGETVTKDFTLEIIKSDDIKSYAVKEIKAIYHDNASGKYGKEVELVGKTASGDEVVLKSGKITHIASSDTTKLKYNASTGKIEGVKDAEGTVTITVYSEATILATADVTVSKAAPVTTSVKFKDDAPKSVTTTIGLGASLEIKDQYGADITDAGSWASSDKAKATVNSAGIVTKVATGEVTITYISSNGLTATIEVDVQ